MRIEYLSVSVHGVFAFFFCGFLCVFAFAINNGHCLYFFISIFLVGFWYTTYIDDVYFNKVLEEIFNKIL